MKKFFAVFMFLMLCAEILMALDSANEKHAVRFSDINSQKTLNMVTVREIEKAPVIDGKIEQGEWNSFSAFCGFRDFMEKKFTDRDITVFCGYDKKHLYFLFIITQNKDELSQAQSRMRDDDEIYRDRPVLELFLTPGEKKSLLRMAVNNAGSFHDSFDGDKNWNGDWKIATGKSGNGSRGLDAIFKASESFWFVEASLTLTQLNMDIRPQGSIKFNVFKSGAPNLSFSPLNQSVLESTNFSTMKFVDKKSPAYALYSLGNPEYGKLKLDGNIFNPSSGNIEWTFDVLGISHGTKFRTVTGYDEIDGNSETFSEKIRSEAMKTTPFSLSKTLTNKKLEYLDVMILNTSETVKEQLLFRDCARTKIESDIKLTVENYPSGKYAVLKIDFPNTTYRNITLDVINEAGSKITSQNVTVNKNRKFEFRLLYPELPSGVYTATVSGSDGKQIDSKSFSVLAPPVWLNNNIGKSNKVLAPFTPLVYGDRSVAVWNRTYTWDNDSMLFNYNSGESREKTMLSPVTLIAEINNKRCPVKLSEFKFLKKDADRAEFSIGGENEYMKVTGQCWIEYDGLCWFNLKIEPLPSVKCVIDKLYLEFDCKKEFAQYYHAAPNRKLNGRIEQGNTGYPWQIYFWIGNCDGGIGFISQSMEFWKLPPQGKAFETIAESDRTKLRVNFIMEQTPLTEYVCEFGLQATPVKPLPPAYHSFITNNWEKGASTHFALLEKNNDFTTVWRNASPYMKYICDPAGADTKILSGAILQSHQKGVPAIPYFAPISFTDDVRPEHIDFRYEWTQMPLRQWKSEDSIQTRACMNSSFIDWMIWNMRKVVRESSADGLYFDGAWPAECNNLNHGCGWKNKDGGISPTYSVLKIREYLKRIALMLDEEISARKGNYALNNKGKAFPGYYVWIHISGSVAPPMHSFATDLFCGEWFKGSIKQGNTYAELLTVDAFRPRYLSQPWGIPNFFLAIIGTKKPPIPQTEAILAYLLPQGVPLYTRYMETGTVLKVVKAMTDFGTRNSTFVPPWKECPGLKITPSSQNVICGKWLNASENILLIAGNCSSKTENILIETVETRTVRNLYPEMPAKAQGKNRRFEIDIPANSFVIFELDK